MEFMHWFCSHLRISGEGSSLPSETKLIHLPLLRRALIREEEQDSIALKYPDFNFTTTRVCSPPPVGNKLGPAARFRPELNGYAPSTRPGPSRLYHLLAYLPRAQFGTGLSAVLTAEEEIFELEEMLDEEKAMACLWGRWVFLNR